MSKLQQSDLILAGRYVDGDLSAQEATATKSRIASDADFAAAVEQIRNQSSLLSELPKFQPADDLADRTLDASMDQVQAIMGAWPVEIENETTVAAKSTPAQSFDWKSTAALVASLASVIMLGVILSQGSQSNEPDVAMNEVSTPSVAKGADRDTDAMQKSFVASDQIGDMVAAEEQLPGLDEATESFADQTQSKALASRIQTPTEGALSGTPMKRARAPQQSKAQLLANNASSPVEQIWCVSQDRTASRNAVSDILQSNRIDVQREDQSNRTPLATDAVEAFYVAATPKQMKLAMSQISSNADIEMIQLPNGVNSPIADAIQKQFAQSEPVMSESIQSVDPALPANILPPATHALAQQLVSNALPRSMQPTGPVPEILKSGTPIDGLAQTDAADQAMQPDRAAAMQSAAPGGGGFSGPGVVEAEADIAPIQQRQTVSPSSQEVELDKYLDDSDQQLRQYLILVRNGEEEKK